MTLTISSFSPCTIYYQNPLNGCKNLTQSKISFAYFDVVWPLLLTSTQKVDHFTSYLMDHFYEMASKFLPLHSVTACSEVCNGRTNKLQYGPTHNRHSSLRDITISAMSAENVVYCGSHIASCHYHQFIGSKTRQSNMCNNTNRAGQQGHWL